ncbi:vomeronasal type-2 receptor 116-like [Erinaceus europaeus]|uniref:Vomeronasal type-2 receptor 116-like n=1 Tax=Erinaceus europaeus TaxID=9365 RepID=A0A1S3A1P1_ERIEU|nr:vomeronasal type-2 receptor 116-like [Erinaceus europaeus]
MAEVTCFMEIKYGFHKNRDFDIGGFFPIFRYSTDTPNFSVISSTRNHFGELMYEYYEYVLAFIFAIEEINRNPLLLPNVSLGYQVYNSYHSDQRTMMGPLLWLSGGREDIPNFNCERQSRTVAVIEGISTPFVQQLGTLLELYNFPQVSYGMFDPSLDDKRQFPSLYQMDSEESLLPYGIVKLLVYFRWTWVGLLVSDDWNGERFTGKMNVEMSKEDICIACIEVSSLEMINSVKKIWATITDCSVNVTVVYGDSKPLLLLKYMQKEHQVIGKVWIISSRWSFTKRESFILDSFHGTLLFSKQKSEIPGFKHFLQTVNPLKYPEDIFLSRLWPFMFGCSFSEFDCITLEKCPLNSSLTIFFRNADISMQALAKFVYDAVYSVAYSLHKLLHQRTPEGSKDNANTLILHPWQKFQEDLLKQEAEQREQLHQALRTTQFTNSAGDHVTKDENRNSTVQYDILNLCNFPLGLEKIVKVGKFVPRAPDGQEITIHEEIIEWAIEYDEVPMSVCSQSCGPGFRKIPQNIKATCCFDCVKCAENEISNKTDALECMKCPDNQYPNSRKDHCLPKTVTFLALEDPLGTALATIAISFSALTALVLAVFVKYRHTPIVKANNKTLSYILLISLLLCFLCSFLFIGHPNTATCILRQILFGVVFTVVVSTILAKTITVLMAFRSITPGRKANWFWRSGISSSVICTCFFIQVTLSGIWLGVSPPFIDIDTHSEYGFLIIECNKGSVTAFYCALGFMGFLALVSFILAFLARNLPDTFNEAKFLTFSMLMFCSVWLTFLPVYHSTKGKVMVAVEVFSILTSSAGILLCIFAPKCYIILVRPDKNTLAVLKKNKFLHL